MQKENQENVQQEILNENNIEDMSKYISQQNINLSISNNSIKCKHAIILYYYNILKYSKYSRGIKFGIYKRILSF